MADNKDDGGKPAAQHQDTFEGFITATKWGVGFVSITLILLAVFFVH